MHCTWAVELNGPYRHPSVDTIYTDRNVAGKKPTTPYLLSSVGLMNAENLKSNAMKSLFTSYRFLGTWLDSTARSLQADW